MSVSTSHQSGRASVAQIKLLKILAYLGTGDKASSDNMYAVLGDTLRQANTGHTISNAIVAECVRTITTIYPNPGLLQAGVHISAFEQVNRYSTSLAHSMWWRGLS